MKLLNLRKVPNYKVEKWLEDNMKEITVCQKEWMRNDEFVRFAPFEFYERRKKVKNIYIRITVIFYAVAFVVLVLGVPFNFLFTGNWGYNKLDWLSKWGSVLGF